MLIDNIVERSSMTKLDKYQNTKKVIPAFIFGGIMTFAIYMIAMTAIDPSYCQPVTDKVCNQQVSAMKLQVTQLCTIVFILQITLTIIIVTSDITRTDEVKKDITSKQPFNREVNHE